MGWCSGSYLAQDVYKEAKAYLPERYYIEFGKYLYNKFNEHDADDWDLDFLKEIGEYEEDDEE